MVSEISRFVFCDHVVETLGEERQKSVVLLDYSFGQSAILVLREMSIVDVKSRKLVSPQAMDLSDVVKIRGNSTGWRGAR